MTLIKGGWTALLAGGICHKSDTGKYKLFCTKKGQGERGGKEEVKDVGKSVVARIDEGTQ